MNVCGSSKDNLAEANEVAYISYKIEEVEGLANLILALGEYERMKSKTINDLLDAAIGQIDRILSQVNDALLGLAKERERVRGLLSQSSAIFAALRCLNNNGQSIAEDSPGYALSLAGDLLRDCRKAVDAVPVRDDGWQDNLLKREVH